MPDLAIRADRTQEQLNRLNFLLSREWGPSFLQAFVRQTAEVFAADSVSIGRIDATKTRMQTLQVAAGGALVDNYCYDIAGTPCEETMQGGGDGL